MKSELFKKRHALMLTQKQMAEKLGCSRNYYTMVERGRVTGSFEFWMKLQKVLDLSDSEVLWLMKKQREGSKRCVEFAK